MSEVEQIMTTNEELPLEQQKKAINLQDLVYVKEYMNRKQSDYETEMDGKYEEFTSGVQTTIDSEIENFVSGGKTAGNATKVQGVDLSDDNAATFGDCIVSKRKLIWSGSAELKDDSSLHYMTFTNTSDTDEICNLIAAKSWGRKYRLVGHQRFGTTVNESQLFKFECEFRTIPCCAVGLMVGSNESSDVSMISDNIFRLPYALTESGDVACFTVGGLSYLYRPTIRQNGFGFQLVTKTTDKLASTIADYPCYITEIYEIIE